MAKQQQKANYEARMITPKFRVSYPHLFKPQAPKPTDKPKYSVTMLFPKNAELIGQTGGAESKPISIKELIRNAKLNEFGPKENWPDGLESPVIDGDDPKYSDKEGYKGHWVIKATTNAESKPGLVDENMVPITDQSKFYPGCYARAYVYARVWEYMGKRGVQFILDHVQKLADGKAFGGKKPVDQVFGPAGGASMADDDTDEMSF